MEVTPTQLVVLLREGTAPVKVRAAIARRMLPLPPSALLESLDILADDPDPAVQNDALLALGGLTEDFVLGVIRSASAGAELLGRLAGRYRGNERIALGIAGNSGTADAAVALLATLPFPSVLEVIGRNQQRLERSPETVAALLSNPQTPLTIVQLWQEQTERAAAAERAALRVADRAGLAEEEQSPETGPVFAAVLVEEVEETEHPAHSAAAEGQDLAEARKGSIYAELKRMTMGQKVALAVKGNREVRNILVHETNKMLCLKVLENPRISDTDIEAYAKSTNISEDVLRGIANRKEWCKKYSVVKALVLNPKAPLGVTLDFVKRLSLKDLDQLAKNRNVPETLRSTARRLCAVKRDGNR